MNIARQHYQRTLARQAAKAAEVGSPTSAAEAAEAAARRQANGTGGILPLPSAAQTPAQKQAGLMLVKLTQDRARLKEIQSIERKIDAKREMLPEYDAWVAGMTEAADSLREGERNDVFTTVMMWSLDTGDYMRALELAQVALDRKMPLPAWFDRKLATAVAEEFAEAVFKAKAEVPFIPAFITDVIDLVADEDMHDQVRAKLHKARAILLMRDADTLDPDDDGQAGDGAAGALPAALTSALTDAQRALELDQKSGVKSMIQTLERKIKAVEAARKPPEPDA